MKTVTKELVLVDSKNHAPPQSRDSSYDIGLMDGVNLSAATFLDQETTTSMMTQWVNDRLDHQADSASIIDDFLYALQHDGASDVQLGEIATQFVSLEDGRIIKFATESEQSSRSLTISIGDVSESLSLISSGAGFVAPEDKHEMLDKLSSVISDQSDESIAVLEYSRDLMNTLLQDGASANNMLSQGLNGATASVKEIAAAVNAVGVSERYTTLASYLLGALSKNAENLAEADPNGDHFDPSTYRSTATVSVISGCWSQIASTALGAIGSMLMVVGGPVVKTIGAVVSAGANVVSMIKNAISSTEFASIDDTATSGAFANALVLNLPIVDSPFHLPNMDDQVSSSSPYSVAMLKASTTVKGLLYPKVTNLTIDPTEYDWTRESGMGWFAMSDGYLIYCTGMDTGYYVDGVQHNLSQSGKMRVSWMLEPDGDKRDAAMRDVIFANMSLSLMKAIMNAYSIKIGSQLNVIDFRTEAWISDGETPPYEVLTNLFQGILPDTWPSALQSELNDLQLAFNYAISGNIVAKTSASQDWDYFQDGVLAGHLSTFGQSILSRGISDPSRGDVSGKYRLNWSELFEFMNGEISFDPDRLTRFKNWLSDKATVLESDGWEQTVKKAGQYLRHCYLNAHSAVDKAFYYLQCGVVAKYVSPCEVLMLWFFKILNVLNTKYHSTWTVYQLEDLLPFMRDGFWSNEGEIALSVARQGSVLWTRDLWYSPGDGTWSLDAKVLKPVVYPPRFTRGSILATTIIGASIAAAVAVSAVLIKKKIRDHQKVKAYRREADASEAADNLAATRPGTPEYKKAAKDYVKKQKKFQRYATKVGYSSNSVGSYSAGGLEDILPSDDQCAAVTPESLEPVTKLLFG